MKNNVNMAEIGVKSWAIGVAEINSDINYAS